MKNLSRMIGKTLSLTLVVRLACMGMLVLVGTFALFPELPEGRLWHTKPTLSADRNLDALTYAIIEGDLNSAQRILDKQRVNVNLRDTWGVTALAHAIATAKHNGPEFVELLIDHGADVNDSGAGGTPLAMAVVLRQPEVLALLLDAGADPNASRGGGATPLHHAAGSSESHDLIKLLLDAGAVPCARDEDGRQPFEYAKEAESVELAQFLETAALTATARQRAKLTQSSAITPRADRRSN